jgi:hypothetical protein
MTIEPAQDALTIEWAVKLFGMAFAWVCALKEVAGLVFERFCLVFRGWRGCGRVW